MSAGNSLVLYLFTNTKGLRTPANNFIVNLAFSDLCMMLSQFPMFTVNCFNGGIWSFGPIGCQIYAATGSAFGLSSICTMAAISYDRYSVIVRGMKGTPMTTGNLIHPNSIFPARIIWSEQIVFQYFDSEIGADHLVLLDVRHRMEHSAVLRMGQIYSGRHSRFLLFRLFNTRCFSTHIFYFHYHLQS